MATEGAVRQKLHRLTFKTLVQSLVSCDRYLLFRIEQWKVKKQANDFVLVILMDVQ